MFYCALLQYHNIKTQLEINLIIIVYRGGCTELLIGGLMIMTLIMISSAIKDPCSNKCSDLI